MGIKVRKPKDHASWCVVIDHDGQREMKAVGSREAAERVKRELEVRLALGGIASLETAKPEPPALPTFDEYSKTWLRNLEQERKPSTAGFYGQYLRLYVVPRFGSLRLDAIERHRVKDFIAELGTRKLAKNTIRLAVTTLRAVLNSAVEDQLLKENPARGLGRFIKSEKAEREAASLRPDEVERLLEAARSRLPFQDYVMLLTALRAGLREGELAALQWEDLQFGPTESSLDRFIVVQRNYDRRWSKRMLTPKSRKSRRVDMSRELRRALLDLRDKTADKRKDRKGNGCQLVFPSQTGTAMEMNNFYARVFKPLVKDAGLRAIRFHDLRHTFGSLLIQAGASLTYVRDQMGHASIQITADVYGHLIPGANISYVDRLDSPTSPQQSAMPPQCSLAAENREVVEVFGNEWLGRRDSNPDTQIQSLQSYR